MPSDDGHKNALVLAGAVAQGAFEAGALEALAESGLRFLSVVAASSGGLSGAILCAGLRAGRMEEAARRLSQLWDEHGSLADTVQLSLGGVFSARGLSGQGKLRKLLEENVSPCTAEARHDVDFRLVVGALEGVEGRIGERLATTFEAVVRFTGADFDTAEGLRRIFDAALASAAFPGVFTPVLLPNLGECVDGGVVNNTPIGYAIEDSSVTRVFVVAPYPEKRVTAPTLSGGQMAAELVDMLVHERLYRDLREAALVNGTLMRLEALLGRGVLTADQHREVLQALPWPGRRRVEVITVRPDAELPGNIFSGFFDRSLRQELIALGRRAAERTLEQLAVD